jgi:hypothetical protein
MPHAVRSRAPVGFLILSLIALPAFAGEQGSPVPRTQNLFVSLWQALADLIPGVADLGPELDPLGGADPRVGATRSFRGGEPSLELVSKRGRSPRIGAWPPSDGQPRPPAAHFLLKGPPGSGRGGRSRAAPGGPNAPRVSSSPSLFLEEE